jgi:hypothetical protein
MLTVRLCYGVLMRKLLLLLVLCFSQGWASEVGAQLRPLPAQGERGSLGENQPMPFVKVGSRVLRLAPGGTIYDQQNRSIVHAHLPASGEILFTKDQAGNIQRIYILTEQERTRLDQARRR